MNFWTAVALFVLGCALLRLAHMMVEVYNAYVTSKEQK